MTSPKRYFNILTFEFPSENQTFYFSKDDFPFPIKLPIQCAQDEDEKHPQIERELINQVYQVISMYWKSVRQIELPVTIKYPEMVTEIFPHFTGRKMRLFGKDYLCFL